MRSRTILVLLFGAISSCATSPPLPPSPVESTRRPVNSAASIELQTCQANLTNTRLRLDEASRSADHNGGATAQPAQQCNSAKATIDGPKANVTGPNTVYVVFFEYAKHEIRLSDEELDRLVSDARTATNIQVRGRTDAASDNAFDRQLASHRADAVLKLLVDHGVDPTRIRTTYQGQGDTLVTNSEEKIRALNRRTEVEIYRAPPQVLLLNNQTTS